MSRNSSHGLFSPRLLRITHFFLLSILVPIFKEKGDIRYCICYRAVKPQEDGMKVVERVLEKAS